MPSLLIAIATSNKRILEMVLEMEEFKLKTTRNKLVEDHIRFMLEATGPQAQSIERILLVMKQKVTTLTIIMACTTSML